MCTFATKIDNMSLLSIGTVAFDTVETPFGRAEKVIGGTCTFISYAASYFTDDLMISAIVGADFPQSEIDDLEAKGVDLEGLEVKQDGKTFFWEGKYHENMNERDTVATDLNVLDDFDPVLPESYKSAKYVMLGNLTPEIQNKVLEQLDGSQKFIAMDTMNFWMDIAMDGLKEVISKVNAISINDEEARQLSGEYSLVNAAKKIQEMGPEYVIIKKGEHGALLFHNDEMFFAPAMPLGIVLDPTGAGDTFAGGMLGYLAKVDSTTFEDVKAAMIHGSIMASFIVEDFSINRIKSLTTEEVKARTEAFRSLMNVKF